MSTVINRLTNQDVQAIRRLTDTHIQAILDHDPDAFLDTCTDDILFLPPGLPPLAGRAACRAFLSDFPQPATFTGHVEDVEGQGDQAFSQGSVTATFDDGSTIISKFLAIHRKQIDGSWKMIRDMWNVNAPAPFTSEDEVAVRKVLDDYMALWNQGKAADCADLYDAAGDLLAVDGAFLQSPDEIKSYYEKAMSEKYLEFEIRNIQTLGVRSLGDGLAILDATWEVQVPSEDGSSWQTVAKPIGTLVVIKAGGEWKISAARLMVPIDLGE